MQIEVCKHWRIRRYDSRNMVIEHYAEHGEFKGVKKPGRHWVIKGYYSGLRASLTALPDHLALSPDVTKLQDLFDLWDTSIKRLEGRSIQELTR